MKKFILMFMIVFVVAFSSCLDGTVETSVKVVNDSAVEITEVCINSSATYTDNLLGEEESIISGSNKIFTEFTGESVEADDDGKKTYYFCIKTSEGTVTETIKVVDNKMTVYTHE